jgi:hypothetical protein
VIPKTTLTRIALFVGGWMVVPRESATIARQLIAETCIKQSIAEDQLTLHADWGSSMKSNLVAQLLADLGVTKTHWRPYVSDDNPPFSESQFRTMKYRPQFPQRFVLSRTPAVSAAPSSLGTITHTIIRESLCTLRTAFITAWPRPSNLHANKHCSWPGRSIQSVLLI